MNNTAILGMIGLGDRTTRFYLKQINNKFNIANKGYSTCPLWINNVDFNDINPYLPDGKECVEAQIKLWTLNMFNIGVEKLIIPNITINSLITKIDASLLITNAIEETITILKHEGVNTVLLIGSKYTMVSNVFKTLFEAKKIALHSPTKAQLISCDSIRQKIYNAVETEQEIINFQKYILNLSKEYKIVVACTELSIALETVSNDTIYDMVTIQIDSFLK